MRPRKPTEIKKLAGTLKPHRTNKNEPKPEMGDFGTLLELDNDAINYREYLVPLLEKVGIISELDPSQIDLLCSTFSEWKQLNDYIKNVIKNKPTYESHTNSGVTIKPYPEYAMRADAAKRLHKLLTEFGMSPSSRSRVSVNSEKKEVNPFMDLKIV